MRKVNDFYSKKAKKEKFPARSVYKLEEAQKKYKFIRRGDSVLDLGCYPGSWSLYASEIVGPKGVVVGVDLKQTDSSPRAEGGPIHWICQDITKPELITLVRKIRPLFRVIVSDLAPGTSGNRWVDAQRSLDLVNTTLSSQKYFCSMAGTTCARSFREKTFLPL